MEIMTPPQIIFPDKNEIIYELKSQAIQFLKNYHLEIKGVAIYPKEIEVYFYQSGVFEDGSCNFNCVKALILHILPHLDDTIFNRGRVV